MIKFIIIFLFIMIGTVVVLHQAFQPDEDGEYLPTAFQATPWQQDMNPKPTISFKPTKPPMLSCSPYGFAPNQTDYSTTITVVTITDGDTVIVDNGAGQHIAKLWGVDAPELDQLHGPQARTALTILLPIGANAQFFEVWWDTDTEETYGVFVSDTGFVNLQLLGNGWAYHSPDTDAIGNQCLIEFENEAKRRKFGVWQNTTDNRQKPWDYRLLHTPTPAPTMPPTPQGTRQVPQPFTGTPTPYPTPPFPGHTPDDQASPTPSPEPAPDEKPSATPPPAVQQSTPQPTRENHGSLG